MRLPRAAQKSAVRSADVQFERFIECSDPHHGFARIYCDACGHDCLLAKAGLNFLSVNVMLRPHSAKATGSVLQ